MKSLKKIKMAVVSKSEPLNTSIVQSQGSGFYDTGFTRNNNIPISAKGCHPNEYMCMFVYFSADKIFFTVPESKKTPDFGSVRFVRT